MMAKQQTVGTARKACWGTAQVHRLAPNLQHGVCSACMLAHARMLAGVHRKLSHFMTVECWIWVLPAVLNALSHVGIRPQGRPRIKQVTPANRSAQFARCLAGLQVRVLKKVTLSNSRLLRTAAAPHLTHVSMRCLLTTASVKKMSHATSTCIAAVQPDRRFHSCSRTLLHTCM